MINHKQIFKRNPLVFKDIIPIRDSWFGVLEVFIPRPMIQSLEKKAMKLHLKIRYDLSYIYQMMNDSFFRNNVNPLNGPCYELLNNFL